jgi:predicted small secreted protein
MTMKRIMALGLLLAMLSITTGCETIKGVGRDITKAGEAIEDAAR